MHVICSQRTVQLKYHQFYTSNAVSLLWKNTQNKVECTCTIGCHLMENVTWYCHKNSSISMKNVI